MATIDLVTVSEAVLTSRQTSEKLQCLYENLQCRIITVKRLFWKKKKQLWTKATKQTIFLKTLGGGTCA